MTEFIYTLIFIPHNVGDNSHVNSEAVNMSGSLTGYMLILRKSSDSMLQELLKVLEPFVLRKTYLLQSFSIQI